MSPPIHPQRRPVRRPLGWRALAVALLCCAAVPLALAATHRPTVGLTLAAALVAVAVGVRYRRRAR